MASDWLVPVHLFFFFFFVTNSASCRLMYIFFAINCYLQLMEFYERVSGARMHAAYVRPGGVSQVRSSPHTHKQAAKRSSSSGTFALNISGLGIPCSFLQGLGRLGRHLDAQALRFHPSGHPKDVGNFKKSYFSRK